jgi:Protein kinase domain
VNDDRTRIAVRGSAVSIGTELNQTYRIDSLLGVGGMGEVFKGHNIQTGDPVAIKIVLPEFAQDETILGLFRKEARILNHLQHDAIVRYYVFSIDPTLSRPYLAMEYVDGPSLAVHVQRAPLPAAEFMPLLRRLADGLHRAHSAGVIHRDMSPDNVILPEGLVQNAKIIDFGIARSANVGGETLLGGSFAGKYNYVSPEQLGLYGGEVTPKSDIYSLALVMVAAMRGRPLDMSGTQVDIIEKRRSVPDISSVPKQFHPVLSAMLTPDPAKRPADMAAIRDWPDTQSTSKAKPEKPKLEKPKPAALMSGATPARPSHALRNATFGIAAVAVVGIGALGGWIYTQRDIAPIADQASKAEPQPPAATSGTSPEAPATPSTDDSQAARVSPPPSTPTTDKSAETAPPATPAGDGQTARVEPSPSVPAGGGSPEAAPPAAPASDNQTARVEPTAPVPATQTLPVTTTPSTPDSRDKATATRPTAASATNDKPPESAPPTAPTRQDQTTKTEPASSAPSGDKPPKVAAPTPPGSNTQVARLEPAPATPTPEKSPETSGQKAPNGVKLPEPPDPNAGRQASLPTVIEPPVPRASPSALRDFVTGFGADNCFAATADTVSPTSASITALGTAQAGQSFSDAFKQKAGFAPAVTLDPVSDPQCGFVKALGRMSVAGAAPLDLSLSKPDIRGSDADTGKAGDPLTVSVSGAGERNIYLFVMDHQGGIQNINRLCASCITMKAGAIEAGLSLSAPAKVDGESRPPFYPMLVFAVASSKPLISINSQDAFEADDFIAPFLQEIGNAKDVTTAVGFVKLRDQ